MSKRMWDGMINALIGRSKEYKPPGFQPSHGEFPGVDIDAVHKKYEKEPSEMVHVSYPTAGVWLESGFYKLDDLKQFISSLEYLNKRNKDLLK